MSEKLGGTFIYHRPAIAIFELVEDVVVKLFYKRACHGMGPFWTAFFKGLLCNVLVCLAVWMALAGRSVIDKVVVIVFPISAFVAAGFEHSIANMYIIPLAMLLETFGNAVPNSPAATWLGFFGNLVPVIRGNLIGGGVLLALIYHVIYRWAPGRNKNS